MTVDTLLLATRIRHRLIKESRLDTALNGSFKVIMSLKGEDLSASRSAVKTYRMECWREMDNRCVLTTEILAPSHVFIELKKRQEGISSDS